MRLHPTGNFSKAIRELLYTDQAVTGLINKHSKVAFKSKFWAKHMLELSFLQDIDRAVRRTFRDPDERKAEYRRILHSLRTHEWKKDIQVVKLATAYGLVQLTKKEIKAIIAETK